MKKDVRKKKIPAGERKKLAGKEKRSAEEPVNPVRGSLTVFAALSIMLIASFLFVLLEATHQQQVRRVAKLNTSLVMESVFSNYCSPLWEKYRILAFDNGMSEAQEPFAAWEYYAAELSKKNLSTGGAAGINHLRMDTNGAEFVAYRFLTDDGGKAYRKTISDYMRNTIDQQMIDRLSDAYRQFAGMDISDQPDGSAISGADDAIAAAKEEARRAEEEEKRKEEEAKKAEKEAKEAAKKAEKEAKEAVKKAEKEAKEAAKKAQKEEKEAAKKAKKEQKETKKNEKKASGQEKKIQGVAGLKATTVKAAKTQTGESKEPEKQVIEIEENPLEIIKSLWSQGTLSLVLRDAKSVSKMKEDWSDDIARRKKCEGTGMEALQTDATDTLLFTEYLLGQFACYTEGEPLGTLAYELEYLLCGNEKDQDNLSETVQRLIAAREAANLLYLATDASKQETAYSVAVALAGVTANPAIIYAVKCGLLAAWALAESILDVRALLSGDKIAIMKNSSQWTSDLLHLGSVFSSFGQAVDCKNGLSYQRYLGFLLMLQEEKASFRAMNLQEHVIRKTEGFEDFCMDHLVIDATLVMDYSCRTIFMGMEPVTRNKRQKSAISVQQTFSYRKAGV